VPTAGNPAKRLAWSLVDRSVVVVGASWLAPVAWRWKQLLNTVAKSAASFESLPQAAHDAIAGFEQPDSLRDHKAVLMLRSDQEPPGDTRRAELFAEVLGTAGIWHAFVDVPGATPLDGVLSGWVLGAFVSAYLALLYGVDPASDEAIEYVRQGLTVADEPGAE
jgi:glucose/mannose-6-phosphate isomerase